MSRLDWSRIGDQARFDALMRAVVSRMDPFPHRVLIPTRPGRDLAIDARSGDGRTVWQFKFHHAMETPARAFVDARKAIKDIEKARSNAAGAPLWADVEHWKLATSVHFNPRTETKWQDEFETEFQTLGLTAELLHPGKLENTLVGQPDVEKHFFGVEDWCLQSLCELRHERLGDQMGAPPDVARFLVDPIGRDRELATALENLQQFSLVEIVGVGGVGKSRFLLEVAQRAMDAGQFKTCSSGLVEALKSTPAWRQHLPFGRTLVLVDEPDRDLRLRIEEEAKRHEPGSGAAFLIAVRPFGARAPRPGHVESWRAPSLELSALPQPAARELARQYMRALAPPGRRWPDRVAHEVADLCGGLPVWIATAASSVAAGRDLPATLNDLAMDHVQRALPEGIGASERASLMAVLRWLALAQPLRNDASGDEIRILAGEARLLPSSIEADLGALERARLVRRRGRLLEVHPDTLADALVRDWLLISRTPAGPLQLSQDGQVLVARLLGHPDIVPLTHAERILVRLARVESLTARSADLLGEILRQALEEARSAPDARAQKRILKHVTPLAGWRPAEVIEVLAALREREVPDSQEDVAHPYSRVTARQDVLLAMPRAAFSAGCGADSESEVGRVLHELLALVREEARLLGDDPERARNDGQRACAIVEQLVLPSRQHPRSYVAAAWAEADPLLDRLLGPDELQQPDLAALRSLAKPLLRLEFHDSWAEGFTVQVARRNVRDEAALAARACVREALWRVVAGDTAPPTNRRTAWRLLDDAHRESAGLGAPGCRQQRADDLARTADLLERGATALDAWESRRIWRWHLKYADDVDAKALAERCAAAFKTHVDVYDLARLCRMLAEPEDADKTEEEGRGETIDRLAASSIHQIKGFFEKALSLAASVGDDSLWRGVFQVAADIGWNAWNRGDVHDLCRKNLRLDQPNQRELGTALAIGCVARAAGELASDVFAQRLRSALDWPGDSEAGAGLALRLYQEFGALTRRKLSVAELRVLQPYIEVLAVSQAKNALAIVGRFAVVDVEQARRRADALLQSMAHDQLSDAYDGLVAGMSHGCFQERTSDRDVPATIRAWLQDLLVEMPDLDFGDTHASWWLKEVFVAAPLGLAEAFGALHGRLRRATELVRQYGNDAASVQVLFDRRWRAIPIGFEFAELVARSNPENDKLAARAALAGLLDTALDAATDAYGFAELLHELEPVGEIVCSELQVLLDRIDPNADFDRFVRAAGLVAEYGDDSDPWRSVATEAFSRLGTGASEAQQLRMRSALVPRGERVWTDTRNELHPRWQAAVDRANRLLECEPEPLLLPYRRAALKAAEHDQHYWRMHAEEEAQP